MVNSIKQSLTVLSFGGGQDSTAILLKLINDKDFRMKWAPGDLIVVMSDTGDEHPETYAHVQECKRRCLIAGIPFFLLTKDMGYHIPSWPSLIEFMERTKTVIMKGGPKPCTDKLKIQPIYKFLDEYVGKTYGFESGRKTGLKSFAAAHGRIRVLIGIAKGEESRMMSAEGQAKQEKSEPWWKTIERAYPLVEAGLGRQECQDLIAKHMPVPMPSNCMLCPYMSAVELVWLHRFYPEKLQQWIRLEAAKIQKQIGLGNTEKNHGVWNTKKLLPEVLEGALAKHGHMSDEELQEYKMSHGHCVKSKY